MKLEFDLLAGGFMPGRRLRPELGEPLALPGGSWACLAGVGPEAARAASRKLLDHQPDLLVSFGFAGGLTDSMTAGASLVPESVLHCDEQLERLGEALPLNEYWSRRLGELLGAGVQREPLVTAPCLVATSSDKAELHRSTGAAAVDMESYDMAEVAADACPLIIVRVVLDTVAHTLPDYLHPELPAAGRPATEPGAFAVLSGLLRQPTSLPSLLLLACRFRLAARQLKLAATALRQLAAAP